MKHNHARHEDELLYTCSLCINVNNFNAVKLFKNFSKKGRLFQLSGVIDLRSCGNLSMDNINELKEIFGENCFNEKMSALYIRTPESVFITSEKTEMVAGQENIFSREMP